MSEGQKSKARDYTRHTIKLLHLLSGNQCYRPTCVRPLVADDGKTVASTICHIEAASEDGPRWNPDMTDDERRHYDNLILLCDPCHRMIDSKANEAQFPVALLKQWKQDHESSRTVELNSRRPSMLSAVIDAIAEADLAYAEQDVTKGLESFLIEEKIEHNRIKRNQATIDEYKVYYPLLSQLYDALEEQGSFKKERLLRNIRGIYVAVRRKYTAGSTAPMEVVRDNADNIFEDVEDELQRLAESGGSAYADDFAFCIPVVMVDAFIRCKILEPPPTI